MNHDLISQEMREHYEKVWRQADPWGFSESAFDDTRYARQFDLLRDRRYARALDIGCGSGTFSRLLAGVADHVTGLDIAPSAIARAQAAAGNSPHVEFIAANIMDYDFRAKQPWDLLVLSETIYCLGWLYSFFDIGWFAAELFAATCPGGRLLLVNTYGRENDHLLRPWLIDTYRDLFGHVGYTLEREEVLQGRKDGIEFQVLLSLFHKQLHPHRP